MSDEKAFHIDLDLTKLGKEAKHLIREGRNGNKYITLTASPRKEPPAWNEWQTHNVSAYDKDGGEGKKNIFCGSMETAIWDRPKDGKKEESGEDAPIVGKAEEPTDDLPF